jgi:hypothetical protein
MNLSFAHGDNIVVRVLEEDSFKTVARPAKRVYDDKDVQE